MQVSRKAKTTSKTETGDSPILQEEVDKVVKMLKNGKSPVVDNIQAEILKHGGPDIIDTLAVLCQ